MAADIGVVGAGAMGAGIAQVAAAAGHKVILFDSKCGAAEAAKERTAQALARVVEKGKMPPGERDLLVARIHPSESLSGFNNCYLVIEAIVEDLAAKKALFHELQESAPRAILASNTSSLSITGLAAGLSDPSRFAGLHFFNPAPLMELVEVVKGFETSEEVMVELVDLMKAWGKTPVKVKNAPGFIVNRCARSFYNEALNFLEEGGADPATIDACFRGAGFKMGPFELIDLVGLDINLAVSKSIFEATYFEPRFRPSRLVEELVTAGRLGRKTGRGFYDYSKPIPEPSTIKPGHPPKTISVRAGHDDVDVTRLTSRLKDKGVDIKFEPVDPFDLMNHCIKIEGIEIKQTYGRQGSAIHVGDDRWISFDFVPDIGSCSRLAIAAAPNVSAADLGVVAGLFDLMGIALSHVGDIAGLIIGRTLLGVVSEAVDARRRGIACQDEIDTAVRKGLNFPFKPLDWGFATANRSQLNEFAYCYHFGGEHVKRLFLEL